MYLLCVPTLTHAEIGEQLWGPGTERGLTGWLANPSPTESSCWPKIYLEDKSMNQKKPAFQLHGSAMLCVLLPLKCMSMLRKL